MDKISIISILFYHKLIVMAMLFEKPSQIFHKNLLKRYYKRLKYFYFRQNYRHIKLYCVLHRKGDENAEERHKYL